MVLLNNTFAQTIDSTFIANHTYRYLEEALQNPEDVYGLEFTKRLKVFPMEILNFKNLRILNLRYNQLTSLPPEIGELKELRVLILTNNQLTALPPEIGALKELRELWIRGNQLISLPPEIGALKELTLLRVTENPISKGKLTKIQLWLPNCNIEF